MDKSFQVCKLEYLDYLESTRNFSANSIRAYSHDLSILADFLHTENFDFRNLNSRNVRSFAGSLNRRALKESSVNRIISSIKSFYKYCIKYDSMENNVFSHIRSVSSTRKIPDILSFAEISKMIELTDSTFLGIRDRVILEMLYSTGCRVSELVSLKVSDISIKKRTALVYGKGGKSRWVFLTRGTADILSSYLLLRKAKIAESSRSEDFLLILNRNGFGISVRGIRFIINKYIKAIGISKHISPHTFRHTFATHMLNNGAGIRVVQELLGHSSIATTQIYTHIGIDKLKDVYRVSHPHGR